MEFSNQETAQPNDLSRCPVSWLETKKQPPAGTPELLRLQQQAVEALAEGAQYGQRYRLHVLQLVCLQVGPAATPHQASH
jgi:hypothetical protein